MSRIAEIRGDFSVFENKSAPFLTYSLWILIKTMWICYYNYII